MQQSLARGFVSVAEAALILGISTQAVYKGLRVGRVPFLRISGKRCLEREGLEQRWWGSSQRLADQPAKPSPAPEPQDWAVIAALLNSYLGDNWPAPPWEADQVATVAACLELAQGRE
jgi:excisionase family DNA binding protein